MSWAASWALWKEATSMAGLPETQEPACRKAYIKHLESLPPESHPGVDVAIAFIEQWMTDKGVKN